MDEMTARLSKQLQIEEGVRLHLYNDTKGILTIGVGHNIQANGISPAVAELMLAEDIQANVAFLSRYGWFTGLSDVRKAAIIDMSFMGIERLLHFVLMIGFLMHASWENAAKEVTDSQWYKDVGPTRGMRVATMIETDQWPKDIPFSETAL